MIADIIAIVIGLLLLEGAIIMARILIAIFAISPGEIVQVSNGLIHHFGIAIYLYYTEEGKMELWWGDYKEK